MTLARKSHGPPLTRPATAPLSLPGGSLLVSALVQFSMSADSRCRSLWSQGRSGGARARKKASMSRSSSSSFSLSTRAVVVCCPTATSNPCRTPLRSTSACRSAVMAWQWNDPPVSIWRRSRKEGVITGLGSGKRRWCWPSQALCHFAHAPHPGGSAAPERGSTS